MRGKMYIAAAMTLAVGCGGSGLQPEDMSAKDHEAAARRVEDEARWRDVPPIETDVGRVSVPTYGTAAGLLAHAKAHRAAARTLRDEESRACAGVDEDQRATCPLMEHGVAEVVPKADGLAVTYRGVEPGVLERHVRCHHAFGAGVGREGMDGCPLYLRNLHLAVNPSRVQGGAELVLSSDDPAVVRRLHSIYSVEPSETP